MRYSYFFPNSILPIAPFLNRRGPVTHPCYWLETALEQSWPHSAVKIILLFSSLQAMKSLLERSLCQLEVFSWHGRPWSLENWKVDKSISCGLSHQKCSLFYFFRWSDMLPQTYFRYCAELDAALPALQTFCWQIHSFWSRKHNFPRKTLSDMEV